MSRNHVIESGAGSITIPASTLEQVVQRAAAGVEGARPRRPKRGLEVAVETGRARVTLELVAQHGRVLPEIGESVQKAVADALRAMCGLNVESVDVSVEELE
jgi:uncharacterized alkaline shock family protein YloU